MQEALDKIQKVEQAAMTAKEQLVIQLKDYEMSQQNQLQELKEKQRRELQQLTRELEEAGQAELSLAKEKLEHDARQFKSRLASRYQKNYQEAVTEIIEKVRNVYGGQ